MRRWMIGTLVVIVVAGAGYAGWILRGVTGSETAQAPAAPPDPVPTRIEALDVEGKARTLDLEERPAVFIQSGCSSCESFLDQYMDLHTRAWVILLPENGDTAFDLQREARMWTKRYGIVREDPEKDQIYLTLNPPPYVTIRNQPLVAWLAPGSQQLQLAVPTEYDEPGIARLPFGREPVNNVPVLDVAGKPEPAECKIQRWPFTEAGVPSGGLGDTIVVPDQTGRPALEVRATMEDAMLAGVYETGAKASPSLFALVTLDVRNVGCGTLAWNPRSHQGLWLGLRPPREGEDPAAGWLPGSWAGAGMLTDYDGLYIPDNGHFHFPVRNRLYGLHGAWLGRLLGNHDLLSRMETGPTDVPPGASVQYTVYVYLSDILGIGEPALTGPKGDGRIQLVLGGRQAFARVDLGRPVEWFETFVGPNPADGRWVQKIRADLEAFAADVDAGVVDVNVGEPPATFGTDFD